MGDPVTGRLVDIVEQLIEGLLGGPELRSILRVVATEKTFSYPIAAQTMTEPRSDLAAWSTFFENLRKDRR